MSRLSRRDFLRASALASAGLALGTAAPSFAQPQPQKRWFKGNLHFHTQWSDGAPLPEWLIDYYKSRGYNFLCPSDHVIFQANDLRFAAHGSPNQLKPEELSAFDGESSFWKPLQGAGGWAKLTQTAIDRQIEKFGEDSVKTKVVGGKTYVRLTPFDELCEQFCEAEKFLLIPGFEQHIECREEGRQVHMNFVNVRSTFPQMYFPPTETPFEALTQIYEKGAAHYEGQNYLFTANHPEWPYYDVSPSDLIKAPHIRVFELLNNDLGGSFEEHPNGWTPEKFWDVVNAWRAARGQRLLVGTGSDDNHGFETGERFSVVRAEKLDADSIVSAFDAGEVVSSTGLFLDDLRFDGKTLEVKLDVREEGEYRIEFIGTKKDYDATCKEIRVEKGEKCPARTLETYSDEIGVVLETVEGTEGSYTMKADDLYVRAKIVKVEKDAPKNWLAQAAVWTQAYCN